MEFLSRLDGISWDDVIALMKTSARTYNRFSYLDWIERPGWENLSVLPYHWRDANRIEYQGVPQLPVTYYEWYNWIYGFFGRRSDRNWLEYSEDPNKLFMQLQYGPITLYDTDMMRIAKSQERDLEDFFYYEGWWFAMTAVGNSISMREGDFVLQYMAIQNPDASGERYEQWSCVNQYEPNSDEIIAQVYNYNYGSPLITGDEAERNGDNIDYQTFYHPDYMLEGPWKMAPARSYYKAAYNFYDDYTYTTCTGVRKAIADEARFNPTVGEPMTVRTGFRIYTDENDQVARAIKDYDDMTFNLMNASALAATAATATVFSLLM